MANLKFHKRIPICPVCNKLMNLVGHTSLFNTKTGHIYGHRICQTEVTVILPGKSKFFGVGLIS